LISRNSKCSCGSGKRYKQCCGKIVDLRKIHTFDNGVKVYDDHLIPVQKERYRKCNVHEAEKEDIFVEIISSLPKSGCFVNIGSAIGYYPLLAKKLMPSLIVHAIEPLPSHQQFFNENIVLNGFNLGDFICHEEGICSTNGTTHFLDENYSSSILQGKIQDKHNTIEIPAITLETLVKTINRPIDLLQMDVQGLEVDVLNSGLVALENGEVRTFLIGTHSRQLHTDCIDILSQYGYQIEFDKFNTVDQPDGIIVGSKDVQRLNLPSNQLIIKKFLYRSNIPKAKAIYTINRIRTENFWFVDIPRTSSSSIKVELGRLYGTAYAKLNIADEGYGEKQIIPDHVPALQMHDILGNELWNEIFSFTFVRNPWDRMVSLFLYRKNAAKDIPNSMTFKQYIRNLFYYMTNMVNKKSSLFSYYGYYFSASNFISDRNGNVIVDFIGRYENRKEDIEKISSIIDCPSLGNLHLHKINKKGIHYSQFYDAETKDIISELYSKDIELFQYSFEGKFRKR